MHPCTLCHHPCKNLLRMRSSMLTYLRPDPSTDNPLPSVTVLVPDPAGRHTSFLEPCRIGLLPPAAGRPAGRGHHPPRHPLPLGPAPGPPWPRGLAQPRPGHTLWAVCQGLLWELWGQSEWHLMWPTSPPFRLSFIFLGFSNSGFILNCQELLW